MALLNILSALASLAQGDISGGIQGFARDSAQGKEEKKARAKQDMARQLLTNPDNQAQLASMNDAQRAYLQDAADQGNFNEIQQGFQQHRENQQLEARRATVKKIYGNTAMSLNVSPEIAQAGMTYLDTKNPEEALQFISRNASQQRAIAGQKRAEENQARSLANQENNAAIQLATANEQAAKYDKALLESQADPAAKQMFDIKANLTKNGFTEKDLELDPKAFAVKFKLPANVATQVQEQLSAEQPNWLVSQAHGLLSKTGLVAPPSQPTNQDLIDQVISKNATPEQLQAEADRRAAIAQKEAEVKAASEVKKKVLTSKVNPKTAKELGLSPKTEKPLNEKEKARLQFLREQAAKRK